jgi:hypothetical protein
MLYYSSPNPIHDMVRPRLPPVVGMAASTYLIDLPVGVLTRAMGLVLG